MPLSAPTLPGIAPSTDILFEPVTLGSLTLPNRLVMAPMGTCLDQNGLITDETIAYYARRARGGVGTVTVEACLVSAETVGPEPRISDRRYLPGLSRLVDTLRPAGVTVGVQLLHPGRQVVSGPVVAASPIPLNSVSPVPRELTPTAIAGIVEDYAAASRLAVEAGFDFVEVHGAHGYLPSNFLSPQSNQRTDHYGVDLAGRARFTREIAQAITAAVGPSTPLVWRLNAWDAEPGGFDVSEAAEVARWLEVDGVSAISVSAGTWKRLDVTLAPMSDPRGHMVGLAGTVRRAVSIPVIAVGRLDDPQLAARVVADQEADLIALGRGLIADPDWPAKVRAARPESIRPCIACNACVDLVGRGEIARCSVNPEVGREATWDPAPASPPRRVLVVGSGPAGLEAARVARLRGHSVAIYERDQRLGGKLEVAGLAPSKREVLRFRDFQARLVGELGVEMHTGTEVTPELIEAECPDVILLAVGADPLLPPIPGLGSPHVHDAVDVLRGHAKPPAGGRVVVVGGSATGCETAELLNEQGAEVTIIEMRSSIGAGIEAITRRRFVRELRTRGVSVLTRCKVVKIDPEHVHYVDSSDQEGSIDCDLVALALGWRPRGSELAEALAATGVPVLRIGDADRPADFVSAINAGADAGLEV